MKVKPRIIVVTGAARGLGHEAVRQLKATGATVIGLDIVAGPADSPADAFHRVDLADAAQVREIAQRVARQFGDVDVLVNNAGVLSVDQAASGVTVNVRRSVDVNLFGPWQMTAELLPGLLRKRGRVVNVSSLFALVNAPHVAAYAAGKRALWAYSDILRMQHRGRLDVVTVFPGFIDTPIHLPAEAVGLSVKRLVSFKMGQRTLLSLEEPVTSAARGLVRACLGSSARNRGTTRMGTMTMYMARFMPSVVDAFIGWRLSSLVRGGHLRLKSELIE